METKQPGNAARFAAVTLKGIQHNSHYLNSEDGECEEIINLRFRDGHWRNVAGNKVEWTYAHGCTLIHFHPLNDTESSTGLDTSGFYIGYMPNPEHALPFNNKVIAFLPEDDYQKTILDLGTDEVTSITHLNNILIIYTLSTVYFLLWDYDTHEYKELEHPILPVLSVKQELGNAFNAYNIRETEDANEQEDFPTLYSDLIDFISNSKKENKQVESYSLISCAYRLYDGSFIMHSQPLIIYCGGQSSYYWKQFSIGDDTLENITQNGFKSFYPANPVVILDNSNVSSILLAYKGIIAGMTIFMTRPTLFYSVPQSREGYSWKTRALTGDSYFENTEYMPQNKAVADMVDDGIYYRVAEVSLDDLLNTEVTRKDITIGMDADSLNKDLSYYMPADNLTHHRLISVNQYIFNRRLHQGNVTTIFGKIDTHILTDKYFDETEDGTDYISRTSQFATLFPSLCVDGVPQLYAEVTLQTDQGTKYVVERFSPEVFMDLKPDEEEDAPEGSGSGGGRSSAESYVIPFFPILSYPDPRATKLRIIVKKAGICYELLSVTLKAHPFLALSYYANYDFIVNLWTIGGSPPDDDWEDPGYKGYNHYLVTIDDDPDVMYAEYVTTLQTDNRTYLDENRLQVSLVDNPFVNPAKLSYQIGGQDSVILGMATSAVQVSDGQFGEFPLFIFTNEGVYTLRQGTDPSILYSAISPISKEKLLPGTLAEINSGIVYCTVDGVKLLSGTKIIDISEKLMYETSNPLLNDTDYQELLDGTTLPVIDIVDYLDDVDLRTYIQGAKIAYNSFDNEIIVCNPTYDYSYVYNIKYQVWAKVSASWDYFIMVQNKFFGVKDSTLYDMEEVTEDRHSTFLIQTRPMKLDSQGYKSIGRIVIRQVMEGEATIEDNPEEQPTSETIEGIQVFGSADGENWKRLRQSHVSIDSNGKIMRVVLPMSYNVARYVIIVIAGYCTDFKFSHLEAMFTNVQGNKLR